jgi:hypothetical protein
MFVYTMYPGPHVVAMVVDGAPVGENGRLFIVPPEEVVEVNDIAGRELISKMPHYGVVEVHTKRTKTSMEFLLDDAREASDRLIEVHDKLRFEGFIDGQVTDRTSKGKVSQAPPPEIREIMHRRNYTLEAYGLNAVGQKEQKHTDREKELQHELDDIKRLLYSLVPDASEKIAKLNKKSAA